MLVEVQTFINTVNVTKNQFIKRSVATRRLHGIRDFHYFKHSKKYFKHIIIILLYELPIL